MKTKSYLIIGLILGSLIGWSLGFLRIPYIEKNLSFLIGFIACLAFVSLVLISLFVWNRNALLIKLIGKDSSLQDPIKGYRNHRLIWILVAVFVLTGGLLSSFLIYKQNELFKTQLGFQNKEISQQSELIEATKNSISVFLMSNLLEKVEDELKNNTNGILSDETNAKISALSSSFLPNGYSEGDSLSEKKYSKERGQLLLALISMNMDSSSLNKIISKASFSGADLRGADLSGMKLNNIDLKGANLKDADLSGAELKNADLNKADLWGSNLREAKMSGANLKKANLGWAEMNNADLSGAVLYDADVTDTKLKQANLKGADLRWTDFSGALLLEANLADADMLWADLTRTNLKGANLKNSNLPRANMQEVNLSGAELNGAAINGDNWLEKLEEWRVIGANEIQENYKLIDDPSITYKLRLKKIKD